MIWALSTKFWYKLQSAPSNEYKLTFSCKKTFVLFSFQLHIARFHCLAEISTLSVHSQFYTLKIKLFNKLQSKTFYSSRRGRRLLQKRETQTSTWHCLVSKTRISNSQCERIALCTEKMFCCTKLQCKKELKIHINNQLNSITYIIRTKVVVKFILAKENCFASKTFLVSTSWYRLET